MVVIKFNDALIVGSNETSSLPARFSGRGPRIKKATAPTIIKERM